MGERGRKLLFAARLSLASSGAGRFWRKHQPRTGPDLGRPRAGLRVRSCRGVIHSAERARAQRISTARPPPRGVFCSARFREAAEENAMGSLGATRHPSFADRVTKHLACWTWPRAATVGQLDREHERRLRSRSPAFRCKGCRWRVLPRKNATSDAASLFGDKARRRASKAKPAFRSNQWEVNRPSGC